MKKLQNKPFKTFFALQLQGRDTIYINELCKDLFLGDAIQCMFDM